MDDHEETSISAPRPADSTEAGERAAYVIVIRGPEIGRRFSLSDGLEVLGRLSDVEISIADPSLSRRHCEFRSDREAPQPRVLLRDLDSTNGTFVNGASVTERELVDGDHIRVGEVVLKFSLLDALEERFHSEVRSLIRRDLALPRFRRHLHYAAKPEPMFPL